MAGAEAAALEEASSVAEVGSSWHVNAPLLYDLFVDVSLEHPALCVSWLPDVEGQLARLALGTSAATQQGQHEVIVCEIQAGGEMFIQQNPWKAWRCDLGDALGFGLAPTAGHTSPLSVLARLRHPTEVNRVAPCPHRPQLLATKAATGAVLLFDYGRARDPHGLEPDPDAWLIPDAPAVDGFALSWSPVSRHWLASGGNDGRCCVWDASVASKAALLHNFVAHDGALCDSAFARHEAQLLATVGDDRALRLWDLRGPLGEQQRRSSLSAASEGDVLTVDWSHDRAHLLASAGKDRQVRVWDTRSLGEPLKVLVGHKKDCVAVRWAHPDDGYLIGQSPNVLASCSADQTVMIWDLEPEDDADLTEEEPGPSTDGGEAIAPELLFHHGGHGGSVADLSWNSMDVNLLCSVDDGGSLQIWQPQGSFGRQPPDGAGVSDECEEEAGLGSSRCDLVEAAVPPKKRARVQPEPI